MTFCTGDLIRVPSQVGLYKMDGGVIDFFKITKQPRMGIFINYENKRECIINVDGNNWLVELQSIRIMENNNGKINAN